MFDNVQKISRVLAQPSKKLLLRIHVKLIKERPDGRKDNFHNLYTMEGGNSTLNIDLQSFLTLELKDGEWAPNKSILIDQRNIFKVIKGLEEAIDAIYNGGVFATNKSGEIIKYDDVAEKRTVRIFNMGNQRIIIRPAIVFDENEVSYEGAVMMINNLANIAELTVDELELLHYTLKETNLFVYSQLLLNYYVSALKENKVELKNTTMEKKSNATKRGKSVFDEPKEPPVQSTIDNTSDDDYFGLNKS